MTFDINEKTIEAIKKLEGAFFAKIISSYS